MRLTDRLAKVKYNTENIRINIASPSGEVKFYNVALKNRYHKNLSEVKHLSNTLETNLSHLLRHFYAPQHRIHLPREANGHSRSKLEDQGYNLECQELNISYA